MDGTDLVPKGPGRPSLYRTDYCEAVVAHMASGASLTSFAAEIDVSRRVLHDWTVAHQEFAEAVERGKAKAVAWWEVQARAIAGGGGGPGASSIVAFGLKNLAPEDWQDRQQLEHIGRVQHQTMSYQEAVEEANRRGLPTSILEE